MSVPEALHTICQTIVESVESYIGRLSNLIYKPRHSKLINLLKGNKRFLLLLIAIL